MTPGRVLRNAALAMALAAILAGCEPLPEGAVRTKPTAQPPVEGPVDLALSFTPHSRTTYRLTTTSRNSVTIEGNLSKDPSIKGGRSGDTSEMVFEQEILSVDEKGNAVAKITIRQLKHLATVKDNIVLDFDSSREQDKASPLAKLIGQSYEIELTPAGQVVRAMNTKQALAGVRGASRSHQKASALLTTEAIRERHAIASLPAAEKDRAQVGEDWSNIRTVDFTLMGSKSYERIYVLRSIEDKGGHMIAHVEMNAIPTSEAARQLYQEQRATDAISMVDNIDTYTGELELDLATGSVKKYSDELRAEWIIVDRNVPQDSDVEPSALIMSAIRSHKLERID